MLVRALCIAILLAVVGSPALASGVDIEASKAEQALLSFYAALSSREYGAAAELYGGSYSVLSTWNPDLEPEAFSDLLRRGCEVNGLQCLEVRRIVSVSRLREKEYRFIAEFSTAGGELFVRRISEDGDLAASRSDSSFSIVIEDVGEGYQVKGLPPYTP